MFVNIAKTVTTKKKNSHSNFTNSNNNSNNNNSNNSNNMIYETIRRYTFTLYMLFLTISLTLLVASSFSQDWMEIDISEEIDLTNITQYLTNNNNNNNSNGSASKAMPHIGADQNYLDVHKKFTFGLKSFCVETRYQTLHTVEKQCQKISIFHKDLEEAGNRSSKYRTHQNTILRSCKYVLTLPGERFFLTLWTSDGR